MLTHMRITITCFVKFTPLNPPNVVLIYRCPVLSLRVQADVTSDENQRKESSSDQQCLLVMSSAVLLVSLYHFASPVNLFKLYIHIYIYIQEEESFRLQRALNTASG